MRNKCDRSHVGRAGVIDGDVVSTRDRDDAGLERVLEAEERVHDPSGIEREGAVLEHHNVGDLVAFPGVANAQIREGNADGLDRDEAISRLDLELRGCIGHAVQFVDGVDDHQGCHRVNSGVLRAAEGRGGRQGTTRPGSGEAKVGVKVEMSHHTVAERAKGGGVCVGGGLRISLGSGGLSSGSVGSRRGLLPWHGRRGRRNRRRGS